MRAEHLAPPYHPWIDWVKDREKERRVKRKELERLQTIDPPIKPVYPELLFIPTFLLDRKAILSIAKKLLSNATKQEKVTEHGKMRLTQRQISEKEIQKAIKTAQESDNVVTKTGKYGTPQKHYTGSNGVTVVIETSGRNAGKIITLWRHK